MPGNRTVIVAGYPVTMLPVKNIAILMGGAALAGGLAGVATLPEGRLIAGKTIRAVGAATDMRKRPPQIGDHWGGCNDARAAGTAPIYRNEPGYREIMDGDNDGIACEPYRGM